MKSSKIIIINLTISLFIRYRYVKYIMVIDTIITNKIAIKIGGKVLLKIELLNKIYKLNNIINY